MEITTLLKFLAIALSFVGSTATTEVKNRLPKIGYVQPDSGNEEYFAPSARKNLSPPVKSYEIDSAKDKRPEQDEENVKPVEPRLPWAKPIIPCLILSFPERPCPLPPPDPLPIPPDPIPIPDPIWCDPRIMGLPGAPIDPCQPEPCPWPLATLTLRPCLLEEQ